MSRAGTPNKNFSCARCKLHFPVETKNTYNKKNYCKNCFEEVKKEEKHKDKSVAQQRRDITDYIHYNLLEDNTFNGDKDAKETYWKFISKQINDYIDEKKDYNYNLKSILYTLKYMYEYSDNPVTFVQDKGILNLPYYYYQARQFYVKAYELKKHEKELKEGIKEPETVFINRSDLLEQEKRERLIKEKSIKKEEEVDLASITEDMFDTSKIDKELRDSGIWGDE